MTMGSNGGSEGKRSANNHGGRTRQPRQRKRDAAQPAQTTPAETTSKPPSPRATREPARRTTSAKPRTRKAPSVAAEHVTPPTPGPGKPEVALPILPEEVVDEAAPIAEHVPVLSEETIPETAPAELPEEVERDETAAGISAEVAEEAAEGEGAPTRVRRGRRGAGQRGTGQRGNALGALIEHRFGDPSSPVRSYSELERRSAISREALSRYVTPRADRRRSPTIDTLAAISDALHLSLEQVARAAVASARGIMLPPESEQRARDEVIAPLLASLTEDQFAAVVELLRQMQPR